MEFALLVPYGRRSPMLPKRLILHWDYFHSHCPGKQSEVTLISRDNGLYARDHVGGIRMPSIRTETCRVDGHDKYMAIAFLSKTGRDDHEGSRQKGGRGASFSNTGFRPLSCSLGRG